MSDITAQSMSDLEILLYDMVYTLNLSDQEIIEKLVPNKPENVGLFYFINKQIEYVRENPKCTDCNVVLAYFKGDECVTERFYCLVCNQQYEMEFPYKSIGGEICQSNTKEKEST